MSQGQGENVPGKQHPTKGILKGDLTKPNIDTSGEEDTSQSEEPESPPPPEFSYSPTEQFPMFGAWVPSDSFPSLAKIGGLILDDKTLPEQLPEFVSYWVVRQDKKRTQGEWEHALIKAIKYNQQNPSKERKQNQSWRFDDVQIMAKARELEVHTTGKTKFEILAAIDKKEGRK